MTRNLDSTSIPENIRKCMSKEARKEANAPTIPEIQDAYNKSMERVLQRDVENYLRQRGVRRFLHLDGKAACRKNIGWPDLVFCWWGEPMAWELKAPNGKLSEEQQTTLAEMGRDGWHTFTVRSVEEAKKRLDAFEPKRLGDDDERE